MFEMILNFSIFLTKDGKFGMKANWKVLELISFPKMNPQTIYAKLHGFQNEV